MTLNVATFLTLTRIAVIPVIVAAFHLEQPAAAWATFAVFAYAGLSDYLDGWVARKFDQVTDFGRFLDPIADKLLIATIIIMTVSTGAISGFSVIAALLILLREVFVSGLREFLGARGAGLPVNRLAKWKTAIQVLAFALLLLGAAVEPLDDAGVVLLWLAAALTVYTGFDYWRRSAGITGASAGQNAPDQP